MNQSILFPDMQSFDLATKVVRFPAQQSGALIECIVTVAWLEQQQGQSLADEAAVLSAFADLRFDIEDAVEALIEDDMFNAAGEVELDL